jgi:hypothetical protein
MIRFDGNLQTQRGRRAGLDRAQFVQETTDKFGSRGVSGVTLNPARIADEEGTSWHHNPRYKRHRTPTLFAALDVLEGKVVVCRPHIPTWQGHSH